MEGMSRDRWFIINGHALPSSHAKEFPSILISLPSSPLPPALSAFAQPSEKKAMEIGVLSLKRKSLDASTEAFPVGPESAREAVRQRFQAELVAVRRLLQKARCEGPPAKRSKKQASPPSVTVVKAPKKKMTLGDRELVAADLAGLAAQLPDDIVEFLEKQSCGNGGGEMEIDIHALQDAAMVELQQKLEKFARERANPSVQERMVAGEEDVDICGGVSPLSIVQSPLKLAEEEEEEDVDICGDASPVAMLKKLGDDETISSSSDSDSDSGSDSSGSESDSSSDSSSSDSESDEDESVDSPAPAELAATPPRTKLIARAKESLEKQRKEARCRAREMARQEVLETERTAMPEETVHWTVLKSLRIVEYNMARPDSLLRQLGLFLKEDTYGIEEQQQHHHHQIFQEDLEEGEIRV
uniref:Uncharacterized protein n=1 Tax=Avena sativa TaxID=4498 RepID=A0ACD5XRL8_AVESA